jgi:propanol-preferring alcohol dehydrogenase
MTDKKTIKVVQISEKNGPFELKERPMPEPARNQVLIKVEACGVCHGESSVKAGHFGGFPRVPGHEVVGTIVKAGSDVNQKYWKIGDRVGVGWHGGHCFQCPPCRRGKFGACVLSGATGVKQDGGYAEYMLANFEALAHIPEVFTSAEAAPLLCAGVTVYNSMRHSGAKPGDLVVVLGIGGLGHLAIQFANRMGFRVVAVSTKDDKKEMALKLGAHHFINSSKEDPVNAVINLGRAQLVAGTAPNGKLMSDMVSALSIDGKLLVLSVSEPLNVNPLQLIMRKACIQGWASGCPPDLEDTLNFAALTGVRPIIETFKLEEANEAYDSMMNSTVRFRAVIVPDQ